MSRNRMVPDLPAADAAYVRGMVIYEDARLLAFDKPSGLPSQTRGNRARNLDHLLWAFARSNGKRPRLVHRLDTGTSGVIIAAKTKPVAAELSGAFERGQVRKTYYALVSGQLPGGDAGRIDAPILRVETDRGSQLVAGDPRGKAARTDWQIVSRDGDRALVRLKPHTGRMHQLRVHMAHMACPILGDHIYGDTASAPRLMLHAAQLSVPGEEGEQTTISADLPDMFDLVLQGLP